MKIFIIYQENQEIFSLQDTIDSNRTLQGRVFNGSSFTLQSNFPLRSIASNTIYDLRLSNFKNNVF